MRTLTPPPFVGLTGGIAAGKSEALERLERLGAATLSTDAVVHELYATDEVRGLVVARWGQELAPGGTIDRRAVAERAFADPVERGWLERMLWPRVRERVAQWREAAATGQPPPRALVVEVPLLFESGQAAAYDATIAVIADDAVREVRAGARGHARVADREARQLPQIEKARLATHVVRNDGSLEALDAELSAVLDRLAPA